MHEFDLTLGQLGQLVSLFTLPAIVLALPSGAISQRIGDIRSGLGALALLVVGATICVFAETYVSLVLGRALSGFRAILITIVTGTILSRWFDDRKLSLAMSISMFNWPLGLGTALAVVPPVAERFSVATAFCVMAFVAAVPLALYFQVVASGRATARFSWASRKTS